MPVQSQQHRTRSSSDPFSDPSVKLVPSPPSKPKRPAHSRNNTLDALRDTVIVRNHEPVSRTRMARPHTSSQQSSNGRPSLQTPRRSLSQDDAAITASAPTEKTKSGKTRMGKKGSQHADVIDRLDFSGVGPMFHHDGPFDACAPSRNRHRTKAPMAAWSLAPDGSNAPPVTTAPPRAVVYKTEQPSKRKVDAIAEAWGIHEPEPFEDFSAGGGDYRHNYSPSNTLARRHDDLPALPRRQPTRKTALPPPQPIFVPEPDEDSGSPPSPTSGLPASPGAGMKRSKSLLHRIRKMRETPNVPVGNDDTPYDDYPGPPSPNDANSPRPTHRSQNSFLGRFGRSGNTNGLGTPPAENEPYVYIEDPKDKALPKPPVESSRTSSENGGYFDSPHDSFGGSPSGGGLGRKHSLLKKVGKAVKGQK